ncbi:hypothetical protein GC194_00505 [bacterium]|nr:hypothetical protein [bacterium]
MHLTKYLPFISLSMFLLLSTSCATSYRFNQIRRYDATGNLQDSLERDFVVKINPRKNLVVFRLGQQNIEYLANEISYKYPPFTFRKKKSNRQGVAIYFDNKDYLYINFNGPKKTANSGYITLHDSTDILGFGLAFEKE